MRIVLDTNVLISALIRSDGPPGQLLRLWQEGAFTLITSLAQRDELADVLAREKIRSLVTAEEAAALVNNLDAAAEVLTELPDIDLSPDPKDNFVLAMAVAGKADLLVTGDKGDLLSLERVGDCSIVAPRTAAERLADS